MGIYTNHTSQYLPLYYITNNVTPLPRAATGTSYSGSGKKRHKEKMITCFGGITILFLVLWLTVSFPGPAQGFVVRQQQEATEGHSEINPNEDEIGFLGQLVAQKRETTSHLKIQNTSDLHNDAHNDSALEAANDVKNVPLADYLRKVVVFQKPFHFHLPIVSSWEPVKRSVTTEHGFHPKTNKKDKSRPLVKVRSVEMEGTADRRKRQVEQKKPEVDLEHLLQQHPHLVPSVNRKRSSGDKENDNEDEMNHAHHIIMGFSRDNQQLEDDVVERGDGYKGIDRKRSAKSAPLTQDLVDTVLGHMDDLVKYKRKIKEHSASIGVKPEEAFLKVVYGSYPEKQAVNLTSINEIYRRRLQFHKLFLEDSGEVEKYHYNEVMQDDKKKTGQDGSGPGPYNAYMKILKRSKRGIKSWFKKLFRRGDGTTTGAPPPPPPPPPPPLSDHPKRKKKGVKGKQVDRADEKRVSFKEEVDINGDSQTDFLLPQALRRSTYLDKKEELKKQRKEEELMEEEEEQSREKEPTERDDVPDGEKDSEDSDDDKPKKKKKKKSSEEDEDRKPKKKAKKKQSNSSDDEDDDSDDDKKKRKKKRAKKRSGRSVESHSKIETLSKDELGLLLEMIFNLAEFACPGVKGVTDGLLQITENILERTELPEYIAERRKGVDQLFQEMLECSSNTENLQRWKYYQNVRTRQRGGRPRGEVPLRRTKRVRKEATAIELVPIYLGQNETAQVDVQEKSGEEIEEVDKIRGLTKLYLLLYQIIGDSCFHLDRSLLYDSSVLLFAQLQDLRKSAEVEHELSEWWRNYQVHHAEEVLAECSKQYF